jgi:hypothetical protein
VWQAYISRRVMTLVTKVLCPSPHNLLLEQTLFYKICGFHDSELSYSGFLVSDIMLPSCMWVAKFWGNMPIASFSRVEVQPSRYHNQDYQNMKLS